jgi:hypothetical protein
MFKKKAPKVEEKIVERIIYVCPTTLGSGVKAKLAEAKRLTDEAQAECPHSTVTNMSYSGSQLCEDCGYRGENIRSKVKL